MLDTIWEMQIKNVMRYHYTCMKRYKIIKKYSSNTKCWQRYSDSRSLTLLPYISSCSWKHFGKKSQRENGKDRSSFQGLPQGLSQWQNIESRLGGSLRGSWADGLPRMWDEFRMRKALSSAPPGWSCFSRNQSEESARLDFLQCASPKTSAGSERDSVSR